MNKLEREKYWESTIERLPKKNTKDENDKLVKKILSGNSKAKEKLLEGNLRLVTDIAKKYDSKLDSIDDLISIATIGLIKAVNLIQNTDINFSEYAYDYIESELKNFFSKVA